MKKAGSQEKNRSRGRNIEDDIEDCGSEESCEDSPKETVSSKGRIGESAALLLVLPHFNFILTLIEKRKRGYISSKSASKSGKDEGKEGYMKAPSFVSKKVSSPSSLPPTGTKSSKEYINMTSQSFTWKSPLLKLGNWDLITPEWLLSSICTKSEGNTVLSSRYVVM